MRMSHAVKADSPAAKVSVSTRTRAKAKAARGKARLDGLDYEALGYNPVDLRGLSASA